MHHEWPVRGNSLEVLRSTIIMSALHLAEISESNKVSTKLRCLHFMLVKWQLVAYDTINNNKNIFSVNGTQGLFYFLGAIVITLLCRGETSPCEEHGIDYGKQ